jgi:hypothetical protein
VRVICTKRLVGVFSLELYVDDGVLVSAAIVQPSWAWQAADSCQGRRTYSAAGDLVVAALASDLESNIVRGVALDLDCARRKVVEVLVEKLELGDMLASHHGRVAR